MYDIFVSFLELPIGVRFTVFLSVLLVLYWFFGRMIYKLLSLIPLLLKKLSYALYLLLEIPVSILHSSVGGVFSTIGQGMSTVFGKVHSSLDRCYNALRSPTTTHGGKAFLIFLLLGVYLIVPNMAGLYTDIFTFWEDAYLEQENRVVTFVEGMDWFTEATMVAALNIPDTENIEIARVDLTPHQVEVEIPVSFHELRRGDSGELVTEIQLRMRDLGFYDGPISGEFGPITEGSVLQFQEAKGLEVNGIFDAAAWRLLFADDN